MTELPRNQRNRLRFGPLMRVLLPSLVTLVLIVLLVFTIFFTEFNWQWVTFLAGILFASVLSLVSASWKSSWRMARRTAEVMHFKQHLSAEIEQHRGAQEQLERELALHQQDRARLSREIDAHRLAVEDKLAAESMLGMLKLHLEEIAFVVDRGRRYRFHTRRFSTWTGVPSTHIDGSAFEEALPPRDAEVLQPKFADPARPRGARQGSRNSEGVQGNRSPHHRRNGGERRNPGKTARRRGRLCPGFWHRQAAPFLIEVQREQPSRNPASPVCVKLRLHKRDDGRALRRCHLRNHPRLAPEFLRRHGRIDAFDPSPL